MTIPKSTNNDNNLGGQAAHMGPFVLYLNSLSTDSNNQRIENHLNEYFDLPIQQTHPFRSEEYRKLAKCASYVVIQGPVEGIDLTNTSAPVFHIDGRGALQQLDGLIDWNKYQSFRETVFGRLGGSKNNQYRYFPYGYLAAHTGLGTINHCGFRISVDLKELANRQKNHLVVAVFGGSTAYSTYCYDHEMFSWRIQDEITRELPDLKTRYTKVDVLNFGQVGSVLLNNIQTWVTFCNRIKPDIVICHFGWNDLALGMVTDPVLLTEYDCTYAYPFEEWAKVLHSTTGESSTGTESPIKIRNTPQDAIEAMLARVQQFGDLVSGCGGHFIGGLQPIIESKAALHTNEKTVAKQASNPDLSLVFSRMTNLFAMTSDSLAQLKRLKVVDLHKEFGLLDEEVQHFADRVHCLPAGDCLIGKIYTREILSMVTSENA